MTTIRVDACAVYVDFPGGEARMAGRSHADPQRVLSALHLEDARAHGNVR